MGKSTIVGAVAATVAAAGLLILNGPMAMADHQGGTTGPGGSTEEKNDVHCGPNPVITGVYVSSTGVEVCQDGTNQIIDELTPQFRLIGSSDNGGYIAYDGDRDNSPFIANKSFARYELDPSLGGSHLLIDMDCGGPTNANNDSTDPTNGDESHCATGGLPI